MADYCTLADVKARIDKTNTQFDAYGQDVITGVSRAIDEWANRPDGFVALTSATARTYTGNGRSRMRIDECVEITLVEVKDSITDDPYTSWAASDWLAFSGDPSDPNFNSLPYDQLATAVNGDYIVFTSGVLGRGSTKDYYFGHGYSSYGYGVNSKYFYNPRNVHGQPTVRVTAKWGYAVTVPASIKEACAMQSAIVLKRYEAAMSNQLANTEFGALDFARGIPIDPDIRKMLGRFKKPGGIGRR